MIISDSEGDPSQSRNHKKTPKPKYAQLPGIPEAILEKRTT